MSENTRRLLGDPPPGRTPWAEPNKLSSALSLHAKKFVVTTRPSFAMADDDLEGGLLAKLVEAEATGERCGHDGHSLEPEAGNPATEQDQGLAAETRTTCPGSAPSDNTSLRRSMDNLSVGPDQTDKLSSCSLEPERYPHDTNTLRQIQGVEIDTTLISPVPTGEPIFERVDPKTLLVDEAYQRNLSPKSMDLITRIAARWDWRRFKPPVVAFADGGLQVIDGQHTAIGAATRGITSIPVMIVEAAAVEDRAKAFIGHNRDRLQVSTMQIHHAAVAAGDVEAIAIEGVCAEAGVALVRNAYGSYKYQVGETIAVSAIGELIRGHGVKRARELLKVLVAADLAPIKRDHIKAVDHLFSDIDYSSNLDPLPEGGADIAHAILNLGDQGAKEAGVFAASHQVPLWKGMAAVWFKKSRKRRRSA